MGLSAALDKLESGNYQFRIKCDICPESVILEAKSRGEAVQQCFENGWLQGSYIEDSTCDPEDWLCPDCQEKVVE